MNTNTYSLAQVPSVTTGVLLYKFLELHEAMERMIGLDIPSHALPFYSSELSEFNPEKVS